MNEVKIKTRQKRSDTNFVGMTSVPLMNLSLSFVRSDFKHASKYRKENCHLVTNFKALHYSVFSDLRYSIG